MRIPPGCPFNPRCPKVQNVCREQVPPLLQLGAHRASACHFAEELINRD
jgi:oligopeptide transport system ATP-binding protein